MPAPGAASGAGDGRAVETRNAPAAVRRNATTPIAPTEANSVIAIAAPDCTDTIAATVAATPQSRPRRLEVACMRQPRGTAARRCRRPSPNGLSSAVDDA